MEILDQFRVNQDAGGDLAAKDPRFDQFDHAPTVEQVGAKWCGIEEIAPHNSSIGGVGTLS
jgi:hypothetical protein